MRVLSIDLLARFTTAALVVLLGTPLPAQPGYWTERPVTGPSGRVGHGMAYDSLRGVTVLFGGGINSSQNLGDTWEWNGSSWTQVATNGPSPRQDMAMAFDSQRGVTVLFGGGLAGSNSALSDTWEWNGSVWTQVATTGPGRSFSAMVYELQRGVCLLFGGSPNGGGHLADTWEWDGTAWTQVAVAGPSGRAQHGMAYDVVRDRTVLFGGFAISAGGWVGDTWEWDGTSWTQVATTGPLAGGLLAMAYDLLRQRTFLFEGANGPLPGGTTWAWDGSTWTQEATVGPADRSSHAMVHDSQRGVITLFGGNGGGGPLLDDTWEFGSFAAFETYGAGCPGSQFTPHTCAELNPTGGTLAGLTAPLEYGTFVASTATSIEGFELFTQSTGGTQVVPVHVYEGISAAPIASATISIDAVPAFYSVTFSPPVPVSGPFMVSIDVSSQNVVVPHVTVARPGSYSHARRRPGRGRSRLRPTARRCASRAATTSLPSSATSGCRSSVAATTSR